MKKTRISLVGFLLSFSALNAPAPAAAVKSVPQVAPEQSMPEPSADTTSPAAPEIPQTIEGRLSRLTALIREREQQLPEASDSPDSKQIARAFLDGDNRGWRRNRRNSWLDGDHGSFRNSNPWRNGWGDGGWRNGWRDEGRRNDWSNGAGRNDYWPNGAGRFANWHDS
jgi:rSAM-associated Gly-rich repeat protein